MKHAWLLLLVAGCPTGTSDAPADSEDTEVVETDTTDGLDLDDVVTVTDLASGDLSCLPAVGSWNTLEADPSCVVEAPLTGEIEDFESGDGVSGVQIELFFDDTVDGSADATVTSGEGGTVSGADAWTCKTFSSRATMEGGDTLPAIQMHWSEPYGATVDSFFNSVATSTLDLMTALLSVPVIDGDGVLAGTMYDCGGEGSTMANVQVVARAADGTYPAEQEIRYFVDEFPNAVQAATSADGLWLIANVPPGDYVVEAYAVVEAGAEPRLIAQTEISSFADSLTVADVYTGSGDGKVLPPECAGPCGIGAR